MSVERLLANKKTAASISHHCLLSFKRPVKHCEGDGLYVGAGDGARTRRSACLEGRVSQKRRAPGIDWLFEPIKQVYLKFTLR